jgi:hypothetical protein
MTKILFALVVAGLAAAALVLPAPDPPEPGPAGAVDVPPVSVCPVEEGGGRSTSVGVVSTVIGRGRFTAFAGGIVAGATTFETGESGSASIPVAGVAAVGVAAGLVELPDVEASSGSVIIGAESVAHESCFAVPSPQTLLAGGFTTGDQEFEVQLMNPYSGEATVDLIVRSESGIESASQLIGVGVPARSSWVVDMDELLPGREVLAVTVETRRGSVLTGGRLTSGTDTAIWNAVAPSVDWFVPVPSGGGNQLVVSTGVGADVEYQVDVYGPDGLVESMEEGVVPARGQVVVDTAIAGAGPSAFRVVATQPVAVFLRHVGEDGVAVTSGVTATSSRWLLPGAGLGPGGTGRMVILNAGLEQASAEITSHGPETVVKKPPVAAGSVIEFPAISGRASAYTVRGEGLLVPMWVTTAGTATAYATGVPLIDE